MNRTAVMAPTTGAESMTEVRCFTAASNAENTAQALDECLSRLTEAGLDSVSWAVTSYTEHHDPAALATGLSERFRSDRIHGASSCLSVMTDGGVCKGEGALGLFVVSDPEGAYGVGSAELGDDPRAAAVAATELALERSGRPDETPALIWISAAPGAEEELLRGVESVVGPGVPIKGGSSGDDTVSGRWSQFAGPHAQTNAVVISALFPSVELSFAFHSGYDPTDQSGTITGAHERTIETIDGEPAALVYDRWTGGSITDALESGGNVLKASTLAPLGRVVGNMGGIRLFTLSHPLSVQADGSLTLFTEAHEGDEMILMKGSPDNLVSRASRVATAARNATDDPESEILGGLVIYCAGCMLAIEDRMADVASGLRTAFEDAPFLGTFTFGEQGCHVDQTNSHGNLMISVVQFRSEAAY